MSSFWVWSVSKFFFQWKVEKKIIFLLWVYIYIYMRCFLVYHSKLRHKTSIWVAFYSASQFFLVFLVPSWFPKGLLIFSYLCALWLTQVVPQRMKELQPKGLLMVILVTQDPLDISEGENSTAFSTMVYFLWNFSTILALTLFWLSENSLMHSSM